MVKFNLIWLIFYLKIGILNLPACAGSLMRSLEKKMKKLTPFGKAVRKYRVDCGETQLESAETLGVSIAFWSAIETGKKNVPIDLLAKIITHFGLTEGDAKKLQELAWVSQRDVKINMEGMNDRSRELVVGFARKFSELDEEQKQKLRDLLEIGGN
jgi:transcriptional regulator with XRE-family HTH domain